MCVHRLKNVLYTSNEIIYSVTVLHAIRWVAQGWGKVSSTTIRKCFRKASILDRDFSVMKRASALDHDPFEDLDEELDTSDLQALISQVQQGNSCSVEEFVNGDQELQACVNIYGDEWSEEFLNSLPGPSQTPSDSETTAPALDDDMEVAEEQEEEEEEGSCEPKLKSLKEAIQCTKDVLYFLDHKGYTMEANQASQLIDSVNLLCVNVKQTHVTDYFNK